MKAEINKATLPVTWEEDLENFVSVFETLSKMCQVTSEETLQEILIMLTGDALSFFSSRWQNCNAYDEGVKLIRDR